MEMAFNVNSKNDLSLIFSTKNNRSIESTIANYNLVKIATEIKY